MPFWLKHWITQLKRFIVLLWTGSTAGALNQHRFFCLAWHSRWSNENCFGICAINQFFVINELNYLLFIVTIVTTFSYSPILQSVLLLFFDKLFTQIVHSLRPHCWLPNLILRLTQFLCKFWLSLKAQINIFLFTYIHVNLHVIIIIIIITIKVE